MAGILFEDIFDVKDIDPDGKKFDRGVLLVITNKQTKTGPCVKYVNILPNQAFIKHIINQCLHKSELCVLFF